MKTLYTPKEMPSLPPPPCTPLYETEEVEGDRWRRVLELGTGSSVKVRQGSRLTAISTAYKFANLQRKEIYISIKKASFKKDIAQL